MRIIGGKARGKKLLDYYNDKTRPTTDRVRENIFNVLGLKIIDAVVLDLFAGTGAYGLESLSRGAREAIFNDQDPQSVNIIKKNCKAIKCTALVLNLDFRLALKSLKNKKFDIIFLDPPYESPFGAEAVSIIVQNKMLNEDGIIVFETDEKNTSAFDGFEIKEKKYGRARIFFLYS